MSKPVIYIILSTTILSLSKVLVKSLSEVPTSQLVFIRAIFIMLMTYPFLAYKKVSVFSPHWKTLLLRGFFGTCGMFLLFYLVQHTNLATSVSLFYLSPIFTVIIAQFLLGDKMPWQKWPWLALCFIGVALIKNFSLDLSSGEFIIAIGAAFFAALAYTMIRKLKGKVPPILIVFYLPLVSAPFISYWAYYEWICLDLGQWIKVILLCIAALSAQFLLTMAYQQTQAHKISHFNYLGLPLGVMWGFFIFEEIPNQMTFIGVLLIFLGLTMSQVIESRLKTKA